MEISVIEKHDSLTLRVKNPNFSVRLNRYSESWSGDLTQATADNIIKFIKSDDFKNYGEAIKAIDAKVLKTLIVAPEKTPKIGDSVSVPYGKGKLLTGTIISETAASYVVNSNMGKVSVQKSMLL